MKYTTPEAQKVADDAACVEYVVSTPKGRRFVAWLIKQFRDAPPDPDNPLLSVGRQMVGQEIYNRVFACSPTGLRLVMNELITEDINERERYDAKRQRTASGYDGDGDDGE